MLSLSILLHAVWGDAFFACARSPRKKTHERGSCSAARHLQGLDAPQRALSTFNRTPTCLRVRQAGGDEPFPDTTRHGLAACPSNRLAAQYRDESRHYTLLKVAPARSCFASRRNQNELSTQLCSGARAHHRFFRSASRSPVLGFARSSCFKLLHCTRDAENARNGMSAASRARRPRQAAAQISYAEAEGASDSSDEDEPKPPPKKRARAPKATKKGKKPEPEREGKLSCPSKAAQRILTPDLHSQRNPPWLCRPTPTSGQLCLGVSCIPRKSTHVELCQTTSSALTGPRSCLSKCCSRCVCRGKFASKTSQLTPSVHNFND